MKDEERNTLAIIAGLILLLLVPPVILWILGLGPIEYIVAILIILTIGAIVFAYDAFLKGD